MALIYVTGGAKSGKSEFAENYLLNLNNGKQKNIYLATSIIYDEEMENKVYLHKKRRKNNWVTVEAYKDFEKFFEKIIEKKENVEKNVDKIDDVENFVEKNNMLVDCLTNMISNLIFEIENIDWDNPTKDQMKKCDDNVKEEVEKLLKLCKKFDNVVIVSNELGMGIVPSYPLGRYFREIAGKMNQYIAHRADEVYFVVSGISMKIKG